MAQPCKPQQNNVMTTWFLNDNNNKKYIENQKLGSEK